ncbi:C4-dicarboxylate ABC transporter [Pseudomonas azotifigens]|uniref:C4-dicarboxylate ABC transporter n=2 Tax=Stutzerimonas azotifigens TaxID=291995 RepID=A0ABR5Z2F0_9GAMM|nr:C4-dicarboxylate ABC transporter [Stutzerimonas azotifigens]
MCFAKSKTLALITASIALFTFGSAFAQDEKKALKFSAVFSEQDIRADMMRKFAESVSEDFNVKLYYGGNLFKQTTEIMAIQRGNLEMGNIAPQDIATQIPEFSILSSAYLFRDAAHMRSFFDSDAGRQMKSLAEDKLGIHILGPTYFGTRQVGLRSSGKIETPEDMKNIKLRMAAGDAWQFLGRALGANPTPMAYAEVYTGLQTGAIDGQDNPLPNVKNMKFYEVLDQIVLTSHLVGYDLLVVGKSVWDEMSSEQQERFQRAANEAIDWSQEQHLANEKELVSFFKEKGVKVYEPNVEAFRAYAQKMYQNSDLSKNWPKGMLEQVSAM